MTTNRSYVVVIDKTIIHQYYVIYQIMFLAEELVDIGNQTVKLENTKMPRNHLLLKFSLDCLQAYTLLIQA